MGCLRRLLPAIGAHRHPGAALRSRLRSARGGRDGHAAASAAGPLSEPFSQTQNGSALTHTRDVLQVAAEPSERREQCAAVRLTCIETLRFIASTASGRSKIVACKVYPCLRDAHLVEQDESIRELVEEVVELTQLV